MSQIKDYLEENKDQLDVFTTAITRAHGKNHPEVFEVKDIYDDINQKIENGNEDLTGDFDKLTKITNNYAIPDDVCPTFEATYHMLEKMNQIVA
ncbi:iron-sulfur cluster repair di-iron protein, ric [Companilactobacillus sp.]|uniref:iron-sulfur cluster repair di-iron protein, ric n=1 Tax=Companilactobacillus sp. TaxID=2767905 RepID=UPI002602A9B7|nr:iron-sulfur cluster repair di-iron protein, ric [Companilactobacillus sp.]